MKLDWQWPAALVFSVVFMTTGALVYLGKLHPEILVGMLTWLIPAPWAQKPPTPVAVVNPGALQ
jgi:hypothetical protein